LCYRGVINVVKPQKEGPMNVRSTINKGKRSISLLAYSGIVLFFVGILLSPITRYMFTLALIGFGLTLVSVIYAFFAIPCPKCKRAWGYVAMYSGGLFSISKKIKFCPYCGVDVDTDI
jgi:hypothetical protein